MADTMTEDWRPVIYASLYAVVALTASTWIPILTRRLRKETTVTITDVTIYPVKSCKGVSLKEAMLDDQCGLANDRALAVWNRRWPLDARRGIIVHIFYSLGKWMFVDARGAFLSQRRFPKLCLVRATPASKALRLEAPGMPLLEVAPLEAPLRACRVWDDSVVVGVEI